VLLELKGITAKSDVGFLTLLEHLRYCEVWVFISSVGCANSIANQKLSVSVFVCVCWCVNQGGTYRDDGINGYKTDLSL